jgi:hypothetical protein
MHHVWLVLTLEHIRWLIVHHHAHRAGLELEQITWMLWHGFPFHV